MKIFNKDTLNNVASHKITGVFADRCRNIPKNQSADVTRIECALHIASHPQHFSEKLSRKDIRKMARYVNNTWLHYSGNCCLLAACLHYNIYHRANILSSKNTASPTTGFNNFIIDQIIFGQQLEESRYLYSMDEVTQEIMRRYNINRETSFIITSFNYAIPFLGNCDHDFNAVILLKDDYQPYIQFVDPWKTFDILPEPEKLRVRFTSATFFCIRSYNGDTGNPVGDRKR